MMSLRNCTVLAMLLCCATIFPVRTLQSQEQDEKTSETSIEKKIVIQKGDGVNNFKFGKAQIMIQISDNGSMNGFEESGIEWMDDGSVIIVDISPTLSKQVQSFETAIGCSGVKFLPLFSPPSMTIVEGGQQDKVFYSREMAKQYILQLQELDLQGNARIHEWANRESGMGSLLQQIVQLQLDLSTPQFTENVPEMNMAWSFSTPGITIETADSTQVCGDLESANEVLIQLGITEFSTSEIDDMFEEASPQTTGYIQVIGGAPTVQTSWLKLQDVSESLTGVMEMLNQFEFSVEIHGPDVEINKEKKRSSFQWKIEKVKEEKSSTSEKE